MHRNRPAFIVGPSLFLRHFSYKDIKRATGSFGRIIAVRSHGSVYNAKFKDGHVALVKEIKAFNQAKDVFYREVQHLGRLHHRHLVALRGFSAERERFLVFENIENGSLKEHLNDPLMTPLNWRTRIQIVIGVAAALEYLHSFCDPPMYHVSISSSNILLDENYIAKISDVGLLSSGGHLTMSQTSCSKDCISQGCKDTIFQLGVLILELITGQSLEKEGAELIQWVHESSFAIYMHKMMDPDLGNSYNPSQLNSLVAVARLCIKSGDKPTFSISHILRYLQKVEILKA